MIDKKQFNATFGDFDNNTMILVIDLFAKEYLTLMNVLVQNLNDLDLREVRRTAHKLKGMIIQFHDPVSAGDAQKLEEAAHACEMDDPGHPQKNDAENIFQLIEKLEKSCAKLHRELALVKTERMSLR